MIRFITYLLFSLFCVSPFACIADNNDDDRFSLLVYNVENLFDLDGVSIFDEYKQDNDSNPYPYHAGRLYRKICNHAEVIRAYGNGVGPDIIAFQEFENDFTQDETLDLDALLQRFSHTTVKFLLSEQWNKEIAGFPVEFFLLKYLDEIGLSGYRFYQPEFDSSWFDRGIAHRSVFLSRFPVLRMKQYPLDNARDILEVTFDLKGHPFTIFNNHWKSGASSSRTEPVRVQNATILRSLIDERFAKDSAVDFVLVGDFNSHHNQTARMGDRVERTAINDVLGSQSNELAMFNGDKDLYNLWYELPQQKRGSEVWAGEWGTLMQIIVSKGLYDAKGIQYVDQSFGIHAIPGLNTDEVTGVPHAWVNLGNGKGCSDHLPIYAEFRIEGPLGLSFVDPLVLGCEQEAQHLPIRVNYNLEGRDIDTHPEKLAELSEDELAERVGDLFLLDTVLGDGGFYIGGVFYTWYAPKYTVRKLLQQLKIGESLSAIGELGIFRGQLQFIIHDESWFHPRN